MVVWADASGMVFGGASLLIWEFTGKTCNYGDFNQRDILLTQHIHASIAKFPNLQTGKYFLLTGN